MAPIWVPLLLAAVLLRLPAPVAPLQPPSPGNFPSTRYRTLRFPDGFANRWGPEHQRVDRSSVAIWLDSTSGSGFKSHRAYRSGYFGAAVKLQAGYTAGVITAFYLSNNEAYPGHHDEVDMEFLGTTVGQPYTLQTNVYVRGSGDGRIIGREMKFHLWFDPTEAFHHYAILWTPTQIIFLVDDVPIRRYRKKGTTTFPEREMWVYGSIWDASAWATDNGKYHADYRYQPFVARFAHLQAGGARGGAAGLSFQQRRAMAWVHRHSLVYNYCRDPKRDHSLTPECRP